MPYQLGATPSGQCLAKNVSRRTWFTVESVLTWLPVLSAIEDRKRVVLPDHAATVSRRSRTTLANTCFHDRQARRSIERGIGPSQRARAADFNTFADVGGVEEGPCVLRAACLVGSFRLTRGAELRAILEDQVETAQTGFCCHSDEDRSSGGWDAGTGHLPRVRRPIDRLKTGSPATRYAPSER